jgi:hypothetical protein
MHSSIANVSIYMNYSNWERKEKSPASLFLDPRNPRIPPSPQPLAEPGLIEELVLHDDVYPLARNIVANGFFPNEALIAVEEENKLIVVEGNRRLAACKLLLSPEAAPTSFQARFKSLASTFDQNQIKTVPVLVPPSRDAAIPLIIARHTATQIQHWEPLMQARFYYSLLQTGASIEDVAKRFALTPSEIRASLSDHNLYQMACRLKLPSDVAAKVRNPREFSITTLRRVFDTPKARQFFGVELREDGSIHGKIDPTEFEKAFSKVVQDVAGGNVDSRRLNSPAHIMAYLDGLPSTEKPDLSKGGTFDSDSFLTGTPVSDVAKPPKPKKRAKSAGTSKGLVPRSMQCNINNSRVRKLFEELKDLSPAKFPNACAFTFRSFLELSVYSFLGSKNEIAKMTVEAKSEIAKKNSGLPLGKQKVKLAAHWTPNLSAMLKRLADPNQTIIPQGHITKALGKVINEEQDLFGLNLMVHNPAYHPTEPRLRATWANLEEFFKVILS